MSLVVTIPSLSSSLCALYPVLVTALCSSRHHRTIRCLRHCTICSPHHYIMFVTTLYAVVSLHYYKLFFTYSTISCPSLQYTILVTAPCLAFYWSQEENILPVWHSIGHKQRIFSLSGILLVISISCSSLYSI